MTFYSLANSDRACDFQDLISKYNTSRSSVIGGRLRIEKGKFRKYRFDHYGSVKETFAFLVDPGRFWSHDHDLVRADNYYERPL